MKDTEYQYGNESIDTFYAFEDVLMKFELVKQTLIYTYHKVDRVKCVAYMEKYGLLTRRS